MLALSRKKGESIIINDDIVITILSLTKKGAKIGISAPPEYRVLREEIYISSHCEEESS